MFTTVEAVLQAVPFGLEDVAQFVCWKTINGDKVPCDVTGNVIDPHDRKKHGRADVLAPYIVKHGLGLAFVITRADDYFFIDLDDARQGDRWSDMAVAVCGMFPGAAVEVSVSQGGLHILGRGAASVPVHRSKRTLPNGGGGIELYTWGRFVALTGYGRTGNAGTDHAAALTAFVTQYDMTKPEPVVSLAPTDYHGPEDDRELISLAMNSNGSLQAMYGQSVHFRYLWTGDHAALSDRWPPQKARADGLPYDASNADMSLMRHLAFWTGYDQQRMKRLFDLSVLGQRDKWRNRPAYQNTTFSAVLATRGPIYDRNYQRKNTEITGAEVSDVRELKTPVLDMPQAIVDLVYVSKSQIVVSMTRGQPRKYEAAVKQYASSMHEYQDPETMEPKRKPLMDCWLRSPDRLTADVLTWKPNDDRFCEPPDATMGDTTGFNMWQGFRPFGLMPLDWMDRVKPFLDHIAWLVPIEAERVLLLQFLAHIAQFPGVLPHHSFLLYSPVQGTGRNWVSAVLARVFRGYVCLSADLTNILDGKFNGELSQKLLAVVDEVRVGMGERKYSRAEVFKGLVNQEQRRINPKYGEESKEYNCLRWLMFTNHLDALPLDETDRRVFIIENPAYAQSPAYYKGLYGLLGDPLFVASVWEYLRTLDLGGYDPGMRATMNSIKAKSIDNMLSDLDRLVIEFRDECKGSVTTTAALQGFLSQNNAGDYSAKQLRHAIDRSGMKVCGKRKYINNVKSTVIVIRNISVEQADHMDGNQLIPFFTG